MYKVIGEPDLMRDDNGVLHNVNTNDYRSYIAKRNAALEDKQRIDRLEKETTEIKETLSAILQILRDKNK